MVLLLAACAAPAPQGSLAELFPAAPQPLDLQYRVGARTVHYIEVPGSSAARIVFIHGSPGRWQDMAVLLGNRSLRAQADLIAPDRPGWGGSDGGQLLPDLEAQAQLLQPLLKGPGAPALLVGYSYGGALAATLALDFPEQVRGALLVAPALDPELEQPRWYYRSTSWWIVRALTPSRFAWSNHELLPLSQQLTQLQPRWRNLKVPVTVIQGDADDQVDPRTAAFVERELPSQLRQVIRVAGAGHYLLWRQPQRIVDATQALLQRTHKTISGVADAG
ncbi:MAG: alpha/beta hydrolase [Nevskia sp.]|nr:alpha/beta hydrolase [Nevskia sp.]